jgi:hypothetical protein
MAGGFAYDENQEATWVRTFWVKDRPCWEDLLKWGKELWGTFRNNGR